ncbi:metal-sensitive transcriptional regulator [Thermoanaerobacterium thermosaccharolyticum]|uniref:metal-sensitive transcriptional regulator n=1 Tax=Thermoanaerobacterium thermosaccharolyticum TaxID=1517 RepID=UPI00123B7BCD|nr:metal-sensitive transcriptional regulator [Thermoanaerobacterium thermosaccharolyticum]KAA5807281.1 metal-sensitive transcriptional regulator [Thermoanaerobacterium thermosaccharolyticum]
MSKSIKDDVLLRLKTIKGHIAGIEKMVEEDKGCSNILLQIAAVRASLEKVGLSIINEHAEQCFLSDEDGKITYEELQSVVDLLVKFLK